MTGFPVKLKLLDKVWKMKLLVWSWIYSALENEMQHLNISEWMNTSGLIFLHLKLISQKQRVGFSFCTSTADQTVYSLKAGRECRCVDGLMRCSDGEPLETRSITRPTWGGGVRWKSETGICWQLKISTRPQTSLYEPDFKSDF